VKGKRETRQAGEIRGRAEEAAVDYELLRELVRLAVLGGGRKRIKWRKEGGAILSAGRDFGGRKRQGGKKEEEGGFIWSGEGAETT